MNLLIVFPDGSERKLGSMLPVPRVGEKICCDGIYPYPTVYKVVHDYDENRIIIYTRTE